MGEAPCYSPLSSPSGSPKLRRGLRRDLLLFSIALLFVAAGVLHRRPAPRERWFVRVKVEAGQAAAGGMPPLPRAVQQAFVAAVPTASHRHDLAKGMRAWRRGIRTLVLTNATGALLAAEQAEGAAHGEHWAHVPDVENFAVTNKSGDYRAALAPLLAAQHFGRGSFRWLLSADDDVAFLWGGLLRMVAPLDADDPYFLSDSYWSRWDGEEQQAHLQAGVPFTGVNSRPPRLRQPRCVPCTLHTEGLDLEAAHALKTCRCTVEAMAAAFGGLLTGENSWKNFPLEPPIYSVDGAGGTVLSAGLLRRLDAPLYKSCAAGLEGGRGGPATCGGGDCLLTACLWQQGFAYTDPGFELQHSRERAGMTLFNAGGGWKQLHRWASDAMVGECAGNCSTLWLDHAVSVHTEGGSMADFRAERGNVQRFLQLMALYSTSASATLLDALAAQLRG